MHEYADMMRFSEKSSRSSGKFQSDELIDCDLNIMIISALKGAKKQRFLKRKGGKRKTIHLLLIFAVALIFHMPYNFISNICQFTIEQYMSRTTISL